jgi:hypothetical protein
MLAARERDAPEHAGRIFEKERKLNEFSPRPQFVFRWPRSRIFRLAAGHPQEASALSLTNFPSFPFHPHLPMTGYLFHTLTLV